MNIIIHYADLNSMECREPRKYVHISGKTTEPLRVAVEPNYADHPLIAGPRYLPDEMKVCYVKELGYIMSGVCGKFSAFSHFVIVYYGVCVLVYVSCLIFVPTNFSDWNK